MVKKIMVVFLVVISCFAGRASAYNEADNIFYTYLPTLFQFYRFPSGDKFTFANYAANDRVAIGYKQYSSRNGMVNGNHFSLTLKPISKLDVTLYTENINIPILGASLARNTAGVNYKVTPRTRVGVVLPLQKGDVTRVTVAISPDKYWTLFYSGNFEKDANGIFGVTAHLGPLDCEFSHNDVGTNFARFQYNIVTDRAIFGLGPYFEKAREADTEVGFMGSYIPTK